MKFSIRSLLLLVLAAAIIVASAQWYSSYQEWRNTYHLTAISVRLRGNQSSDITHKPSVNFIIDSATEADSVWLNLNVGYFNHAGDAGGTGWGWMALPVITANDNEFRHELHNYDFSDLSPNRHFPQTLIRIKHSQLVPRLSELEITTVLVDANGNKLDTMIKSITITDVPRKQSRSGKWQCDTHEIRLASVFGMDGLSSQIGDRFCYDDWRII